MTDSPWLWIGFNVFVLAMLALDLGVFHRKAHIVSFRESITWTCVWVALALVFNAGVWHFMGPQKGLEFFTGYVIEKSLSVDNVFVFALLFSYFAVPPLYQHKVLFWGVLGARRVRWSLPAAIISTGLLALVFAWRAGVGWLAVMDGHSEKWFAATLISLMLAASVALLPVLLRARRPGPSATANPEDKR